MTIDHWTAADWLEYLRDAESGLTMRGAVERYGLQAARVGRASALASALAKLHRTTEGAPLALLIWLFDDLQNGTTYHRQRAAKE